MENENSTEKDDFLKKYSEFLVHIQKKITNTANYIKGININEKLEKNDIEKLPVIWKFLTNMSEEIDEFFYYDIENEK